MAGEDFETYDFLINDEDEAMLLLYVREGEPENDLFLKKASLFLILFLLLLLKRIGVKNKTHTHTQTKNREEREKSPCFTTNSVSFH